MLGKKSLLVLVLCSSLSFLVLGFDELNDEDVTDEMTEEFKTFFQTISYIHIPKNGGTEMEKIIQRLSGLSFGWRSYLDGTTNKTNWHVNTTHFCEAVPAFRCAAPPSARAGICAEGGVCAYWHVPPYTFKPPYHPWLLKTLRFCHIRNPFTRAVSELLFKHGALRKLSPTKVQQKYIPLLHALTSNPDFLQPKQKVLYFNNVSHPLHPAHRKNIYSLSSSPPSVVIPFPKAKRCYMNPHEHCHNIPQSRYVEPFVTADYIQDLYYYLKETKMDCYKILRVLQEKHETKETKATGLNCNFPLRFEQYTHDFNLLLRRCGPLPDFVFPGRDHADNKYSQILDDGKVKFSLQKMFWEDVVRFGYTDYPV